MPRLNGKSSHGSKPITSLRRTLSWMPHCWPQKQQWVLTRRSGSSALEPSVRADRCGPNAFVIASSSTGNFAISPLPPQRALREAEHGAPARRADLLVVRRATGGLVLEAELALDRDQIPDHRRRRVRATAARA